MAELHNLPVQLTSFIGREGEVADLTRRLASTRLLTLTGPGGAGKTRLAIEAAGRIEGGQVWFVDLSPIVDAALIPAAIGTAAGIAEVAGEAPLETLATALAAAQALLVLDNCEHLVVPCAVAVAHLLQACPSLTVLTTSREPLNLSGEHVYRLHPLGVGEAAVLFRDRAAVAEPSFAARSKEPAQVESICSRLDGLPLAIELAAPYVRLLSLKELAARLDQRFELLQSRTPTAAARHQTLRALVDWSYELLSPEEQRLYRGLSVFAGGCSFDAIEGICSDEAGAEDEVLALLRGLVEKSLVLAEEQEGETRYRMLETLRQHSRDKLREAGEERELRRRHLQWFRDLAERGDRAWRGVNQDRWQRPIEHEVENCRVALVWSRIEPDQRKGGLRLAAALGSFWRRGGHASEAFDWLMSLLDGAPPDAARAKALHSAGWLAVRRGEPDPRPLLLEALSLARSLDERWTLVACLRDLAYLWLEDGDPAAAKRALDEGLALARTPDTVTERSALLRLLGRTVAATGQPQEAIAHLKEAVRLAREREDQYYAGLALRELGSLFLDTGDLVSSRICLGESLEPETRRADMIQTLACFVGLAVAEGDMAGALRLGGAVAGLREAWPDRIASLPLALLTQRIEAASAAVSPGARIAAWSEGSAMSLHEAIDYALRRSSTDGRAAEPPGGLTPRELEIAQLLAGGLTNRQIGAALVISERTAHRHVANILGKLQLSNRTQVATWAVERGLVHSAPR